MITICINNFSKSDQYEICLGKVQKLETKIRSISRDHRMVTTFGSIIVLILRTDEICNSSKFYQITAYVRKDQLSKSTYGIRKVFLQKIQSAFLFDYLIISFTYIKVQ